MKKVINILSTSVMLCAFSIPTQSAFGQVQEAADNFDVPTFEAKTLDVHGLDLFSYDDAGSLGLNLGSDFLMTNQSPTLSWSVSNDLEIDVNQADKDAELGHNVTNVLRASYQRFFGGSHGVSVIGGLDLAIGLSKMPGASDSSTSLAAVANVGGAYGRRLDARTVAQAAAMCGLSNKTCSAADLAKIADIIGKNSVGYYTAKHKFDANINFYADLVAATGGEAFKLAQVLSSPIYNVGSRQVGYEGGATLNVASGDHLDDADAAQSMYAQVFAGYAMLLNDNSGINADLSLDYGLKQEGVAPLTGHPGDGNIHTRLDLGYNLDHSVKWNTGANAYVNFDMPKEGDAANSFGLHAETNYALASQALVGAELNLCGGKADSGTLGCSTGADELHWSVLANFQYFVF